MWKTLTQDDDIGTAIGMQSVNSREIPPLQKKYDSEKDYLDVLSEYGTDEEDGEDHY